MKEPESLIREGMAKAKIKTITELCKRIGMVRQTMTYRFEHPGTFTAREIQALIKLFNWTGDETAKFLKSF